MKQRVEGVGAVDDMNRSQRRKIQRDQNKEVEIYNSQNKWIDNLQPHQKQVIENMLREMKVDSELDCIEVVDKILTGALLEHGLTWEEAYNFNVEFGKYYAEYKFAVSRIGKENSLKMLQDLEREIIIKIETGIMEGKSRGQIVKEIKCEYKGVGLTTPEANNVYGRTFENYKKGVKEVESRVVEEMVADLYENKISDDIIKKFKTNYSNISENDIKGMFIIAKDEFLKPKYDDYSKVEYVGAESEARSKENRKAKKETAKKQHKTEEKLEEDIVEVENDSKEVLEGFNKVVKEKKMSNLKIVNEVIKVVSRELEGEFGKYVADENGVTREDKLFKDLASVEAYKKEQLEKFELEIAELNAVFEMRDK